MGVTFSQSQSISSPNGNSLAVYVDGLTGTLMLKDINGITQPVQDYIQGGGGGGGTSIYAGDSPTTVIVQNIPSGTDITGFTYDALFQNIYAPYVAPAFTSFGITQTTPIEVGTTITGLKQFTWGFSTPSNLQPNSVSVIDFTNAITLQSGINNTSPQNVNIGSVQKIVSSSNQWRATAINTKSNVLTSLLATVNWWWYLYYGVSANATLNEAQIKALTGTLRATQVGDFNFPVLNYKYFCFPNTTPFGNVNGFKDTATNLDVPMADSTNDAFYGNTQLNGLSYGLVNVTNSQGIAVDYRVYRSKNVLGGAITIRVS